MKGREGRNGPCATDTNRNGLRHFGRSELAGGMSWWAVAGGGRTGAAESDRRAGAFEAQGKQAPPLQGEAGLRAT
jgi:hypothetical protein